MSKQAWLEVEYVAEEQRSRNLSTGETECAWRPNVNVRLSGGESGKGRYAGRVSVRVSPMMGYVAVEYDQFGADSIIAVERTLRVAKRFKKYAPAEEYGGQWWERDSETMARGVVAWIVEQLSSQGFAVPMDDVFGATDKMGWALAPRLARMRRVA